MLKVKVENMEYHYKDLREWHKGLLIPADSEIAIEGQSIPEESMEVPRTSRN